MKKTSSISTNDQAKKGYNEHNPGQPQGAFPPASSKQEQTKKDTKSTAADTKSTAADKKSKEDNKQ